MNEGQEEDHPEEEAYLEANIRNAVCEDRVNAVVHNRVKDADQPKAVYKQDLEGHKSREASLAVLPFPFALTVLVHLDHCITVQKAGDEEHYGGNLHPTREIHCYTDGPLPEDMGDLVFVGVVVPC